MNEPVAPVMGHQPAPELPLRTFAVVRRSDGYVLQRVTCPTPEDADAGQDYEVVELTENLPPGLIRLDRARNKFVAIPPAPSVYHQWQGNDWVDQATVEQRWSVVRGARDAQLAATDWVVMRAVERGQPVPPEFQSFRQALRDVTKQPDPFNIVWPAQPAGINTGVSVGAPTEEI